MKHFFHYMYHLFSFSMVFFSLFRTFANMNEEKKVLIGMTPEELSKEVELLGMPRFTAKQLTKWLYEKRVASIDEMTDISKANREKLAEKFCVGTMNHVLRQESVDGTVKYLFPVITQKPEQSLKRVETVFIPDKERATLCVSSQVGCRMGCHFCQTGRQGFEGNLTAGDILNQILALPERERLTNIVFMGQGEPMDNIDAVLRATEILTAPWGFAWSPKRITVSSVGMPNLRRFLDESLCHVAISMHAPLPEVRRKLMPAENGMGIEKVMEMLREYDFTHQRRLSFEYIVFKGVNDSRRDMDKALELLKGIECRVNLIRFHKIPDADLEGVDQQHMEMLRDYLTARGITTTIRASRGEDIFAACGMLYSKERGE